MVLKLGWVRSTTIDCWEKIWTHQTYWWSMTGDGRSLVVKAKFTTNTVNVNVQRKNHNEAVEAEKWGEIRPGLGRQFQQVIVQHGSGSRFCVRFPRCGLPYLNTRRGIAMPWLFCSHILFKLLESGALLLVVFDITLNKRVRMRRVRG